MERNAVGGFGFVQGAAAGVELRADFLEPRFQGLGDEFFVEAAGEGRHSGDCRSGICLKSRVDWTRSGRLRGYHPGVGPRFDDSNLTGRLIEALFERDAFTFGSSIMATNCLSYGFAV